MAAEVSPYMDSPLNPDAALFVPSYAQENPVIDHASDDAMILIPEWDVEDFSPEWWILVQTSPEFREFWLYGYEAGDAEDALSSVRYEDEEDGCGGDDNYDDDDDVFDAQKADHNDVN